MTSAVKFYNDQKQNFPKESNIMLDEKLFSITVKKLTRHFKIYKKIKYGKHGSILLSAPLPFFTKFARKGSEHEHRIIASACYSPYVILVHYQKVSLLTLCHELAHLHTYINNMKKGHNKQLMNTIEMFINYCRKKQYWGLS